MKDTGGIAGGTGGVHRLLCVLAASAAVLLAAAEKAEAVPRVERYVNFSVTPTSLDLGSVPQPGVYNSPAELKVHVTANCVHGGVVASATPLTRAGGGSIGTDRVFIKLPGTGNYMPMIAPVPVTGPMNPGVFDVILKFRVETTLADVAGEYAGTITITCSAAP